MRYFLDGSSSYLSGIGHSEPRALRKASRWIAAKTHLKYETINQEQLQIQLTKNSCKFAYVASKLVFPSVIHQNRTSTMNNFNMNVKGNGIYINPQFFLILRIWGLNLIQIVMMMLWYG